MKCDYCENELPGAVSTCPFCGGAVGLAASASNAPANMGNAQKTEPLRQGPGDEALEIDKELARPAAELEIERGNLERLRNFTVGDAEKSPYKRAIFLLLGIFLCFWGVQFLYVNRFILFATMMVCFAIAMLSPEYEWVGGLSTTISFVASFLIKTDSKKRKMAWF